MILLCPHQTLCVSVYARARVCVCVGGGGGGAAVCEEVGGTYYFWAVRPSVHPLIRQSVRHAFLSKASR